LSLVVVVEVVASAVEAVLVGIGPLLAVSPLVGGRALSQLLAYLPEIQ